MSTQRNQDEFAEILFEFGFAETPDHARKIADVINDPHLSGVAKQALVLFARKRGAAFDPGAMTEADIKEAIKDAIDLNNTIMLSMCEPVGSA